MRTKRCRVLLWATKKYVFYASFACCLFYLAGCATIIYPQQSIPMMRAVAESNSGSFIFYGQVIDQYGHPISDLKVNLGTQVFNPLLVDQYYTEFRRHTKKTDKNGRFQFKGKGGNLSVEFPCLKGYEYLHEQNPRDSFNFSRFKEDDFLKYSSAEKPYVFHLRKKSKPVFLLSNQGLAMFCFSKHSFRHPDSRIVRDDGVEKEWDLNQPMSRLVDLWGKKYYDQNGNIGKIHSKVEYKEYSQHRRKGVRDLKVSGQMLEPVNNIRRYQITVTPLVENSGVLLSNERLLEAPEAGYQPSVSMVFTDEKSSKGPKKAFYIKKALCIKLEGGRTYAMIQMGRIRFDKDRFLIDADIYVNPSGSRSFEYDKEYQMVENQWRRWLYDMRRSCRNISEDLLDSYQYATLKDRQKEMKKLARKKKLKKLPGIREDGSYDEQLFLKDMRAIRETENKKNPHWWHDLEG